MRKFWTLLFLFVPVFSIGLFAIAPSLKCGFPPAASSFAQPVDHLYWVIFVIVAVAFVATEGSLVYFLWKYGHREGQTATYVHGNHRLEIIWTIIPAGILVFIAFYQFDTWKEMKFASHIPEDAIPLAEVTAGQFEWRIKYPGRDGVLGTADDVHTLNLLHVPKDRECYINLRTRDVLHSFFIPVFRVKQDAVPGMTIKVRFRATKTRQEAGLDQDFELVCAELCGWGHYKMRGHVIVDSQKDFDDWMRKKEDAKDMGEEEVFE